MWSQDPEREAVPVPGGARKTPMYDAWRGSRKRRAPWQQERLPARSLLRRSHRSSARVIRADQARPRYSRRAGIAGESGVNGRNGLTKPRRIGELVSRPRAPRRIGRNRRPSSRNNQGRRHPALRENSCQPLQRHPLAPRLRLFAPRRSSQRFYSGRVDAYAPGRRTGSILGIL